MSDSPSDDRLLLVLQPDESAIFADVWTNTVDRWFIPLFRGFCTSQVMHDFFHQQYDQRGAELHHSSQPSTAQGNLFLDNHFPVNSVADID